MAWRHVFAVAGIFGLGAIAHGVENYGKSLRTATYTVEPHGVSADVLLLDLVIDYEIYFLSVNFERLN